MDKIESSNIESASIESASIESAQAESVFAFCYQTTVRARYAETDQMGVVHHASMIIWLEDARVAFLEHIGVSYHTIEAEQLYLMMSDIQITYRAPAYFDQHIRIVLQLKEVRSRRLVLAYRLYNAQQQCLAEAQTMHIMTNTKYQTVRMPERLLTALHTQQAQQAAK